MEPERRRDRQRGWWFVYLVAFCLLAAACTTDGTQDGPGPEGPVGPAGDEDAGVPGSGVITTETRDVADFDRLVFASEGTVILTRAPTVSLSIDADDNLHQYLMAEVTNGELVIATTPNTDIAPSETIVFRVGTVDLTGIELTGVGTVTAATLDGTGISVALTGVGDIVVDELRADELSVEAGGVGTVRLSGEADRQTVSASGLGVYAGADLVSRAASVEASGSGAATVHVVDELTIVASEAGAVSFYGSPRVEQQVFGSASVTPLGAK